MFSFLKKTPKEERTMCLLVITSYSVTAAVVRTYHREGAVAKPVVLFSCEEKIPHQRTLSSGQFEHLVEIETKKALEKCRKIHGNYDKIVCVVGEPWAMTKNRIVSIEKPKPFKITQKIIDEAILRDSRLFEQEALRDYAKEQEWGIMHSTQPVAAINGYPVPSPLGMLVKSLELRMSTSLVPTYFVEMIMGVYADVFHRTDISFMGMEESLVNLIKHQGDVSVVTLGGISSTFSLFNQGALNRSEKINSGLVEFEDAIAYLFEVNHAHVASVMKFASDVKILEHERDVYYQRIESAYKNMSAAIRGGLLSIKKQVGNIPEPVVLIASPVWVPMVQPLLEKDLEVSVIIPQADRFDDQVLYTHDARIKNISLSLAILSALENYG